MDRYKRFISKKNKIYRPYTLDGIGNFYFSPGTNDTSYALQVYPDGVVDGVDVDDVGFSYGRTISPDTNRNEGARYIYRDGDSFSGNDYNIRDSYGHLFDRLFQNSIIFVVKIAEPG